jgi:ubiquinone/menaquinone biosynthesis C-methylase UbiE
MKYEIDSQTYELLYAKYLRGDRTKEMVSLAGDLKGKKVVNLCCGAGRLTIEALKRGATVLACDESTTMLKGLREFQKTGKYAVNCFSWDVSTALRTLRGSNPESVHAIFCQQAVNYWFDPSYVKLLRGCLAPGGVFIFNTFNKCPSTEPKEKAYFLDRHYMEISWLVGNMVKHVQIAEGMDPHFTEFKWIPPEEFMVAFRKEKFDVAVLSKGSTDIYVCTKS